MKYWGKGILSHLAISLLSLALFLKCEGVQDVPNQLGRMGPIERIDQYVIQIPVKVREELKAASPGVGSGLTFKGMENGLMVFFAVPDRGMTTTLPKLESGTGVRMFLKPDYIPSIIRIAVAEGGEAVASIEMQIYMDGLPASGLPPPMGMGSRSSNIEIPVDPELTQLTGSLQGLDTESLDIDANGDFWIADEYWPAVLHVSGKTGHTLQKYLPGDGLPDILQHIQRNNGFEAIAVAPNGKVYVPLETVLDIDQQTAKRALVIRIIELDPATGQTRMIGYPVDPTVYRFTHAVKISDLVSYDDTHFIVVEQGTGHDGRFRNSVCLMNIANADDLTVKKLSDGREVEYASLHQLKDFHLVARKPFFNLRDYGWHLEKMEGLALVKNRDDRTLAVVNDNDFDYDETLGSYGGIAKDPQYCVRFDKNLGQLLFNEEPISLAIPGKPKDEPTSLWIIHLNVPLIESFRVLDEEAGLITTIAKPNHD